MRPAEMGKLMVWLLGVFPQWKPDPGVAAAWSGELPDVPAEQAVLAVRRMQARKPCPFPPSVFEITSEIAGCRDKLAGRQCWQKVLKLVRERGCAAYPYPELDEPEREAVRLIGGIKVIGNSEEGDPFIEKRFLEVFDNIKEASDVLRIGSAGQVRALGDGEDVRSAHQLRGVEKGLARLDGGS